MPDSTILHLASILRCYVDEYGAKNVRVNLPVSWGAFGPPMFGAVKVIYSSASEVQIQVNYNGQSFGYATSVVHILEQTEPHYVVGPAVSQITGAV